MTRAVVAVAFSGGRDSTALLHATLAAAEPLGIAVVALHVHHGLSSRADDWLAHCDARCRRWARRGRPLAFVAHRLDGRPAAGESVEAWARQARYQALRSMALEAGADLVLLAHHRRDQAETFVLQALRGGGVDSLASMPRVARREGVTWARPWLDQPREAIEAYVQRHRLAVIDDDTNGDERFARNRLRARVWPALIAAFADAETCFASAAQRAHEASALLSESATDDLQKIASPTTLDIVAWRALSQARRLNALRAWLRRTVGAAPPSSLILRLARELDDDGSKRWPAPGGELHSRRGRLCFEPTRVQAAGEPRVVDLSRVGTHQLPDWRGAIRVAAAAQGGIALAVAARLELRAREGGERFQSGLARPARSLKKEYQTANVPAWERDGPIFCSEGRSVFVPGLGVDARAVAAPGEPQVTLTWLPRRSGAAD